jgi:ribonuclease III
MTIPKFEYETLPPLPEPLPTQYETEVFTHISTVSNQSPSKSYERLACLGNAVLNLVVTQILFDHQPQLVPGRIHGTRADVVAIDTVKVWGRLYNFDQKAIVATSVLQNQAARDNFASAVFYAYIGAMYGADRAQVYDFIKALMQPLLKQLNTALPTSSVSVDSLRELNECLTRLRLENPTYVYEENPQEPDPNQRFSTKCYVEGVVVASGRGGKKKHAQRAAAQMFLDFPDQKKTKLQQQIEARRERSGGGASEANGSDSWQRV